MESKDKQNLLKSWPIYAMFVMMLIGLVILYRKNPPPNQSLSKSISRHFDQDDVPLDTLDNIINARTSWEPILPESLNRPVGNFGFVNLQEQQHQLSDFSGRPVIVFFFASWSPACKMMRPILQEIKLQHEEVVIIGLSSESSEQLNDFAEAIPLGFHIGRQDKALPEPFSDVTNLPTCFFIKPDGTLKLAATGMIPFEHFQAIIRLSKENTDVDP
ncbi:MAG: TlpA family protein disulfide reductase [Planctomycetota bacterium]|jgi:thiol-disulfide isomerase/thioredoxin